jgi:hypothetical protein
MEEPKFVDKCYGCNKRWLELEDKEDPNSWIWNCGIGKKFAEVMAGCPYGPVITVYKNDI